MRYLKLIFGILITFISYLSMIVQFMLLSENSINKNQLIIKVVILLLTFALGAAVVISYRKEEERRKEGNGR